MDKSYLNLKMAAGTAILTLLLCLGSCIPKGSALNESVCPELPQGCYPQKWEGSPLFDTAQGLILTKGFYYKIEPVSGINSPDNEWQLAFISSSSAVFSFSESGLNKAMTVRKINDAKFSVETGISGLPETHTGAFSIKNGLAAYTVSPVTDKNFLKVHGDYTLASVDNIIGKSRIMLGNFNNSAVSQQVEYSDSKLKKLDWSGQPSLSPKKNAMVFSSDREGGEGGTDLWLAVINPNGTNSQPVNLGNNVNSRCDEITPFINDSGTRLYFASAGHSTVGGYDLFFSEIDSKFWDKINSVNEDSDLAQYFSKPVNLGFPVNTVKDEIFPTCNGDCEKTLYYSSDQNSASASIIDARGGFDLYVIHKIDGKQPEKDIVKKRELTINKSDDTLKNKIKTPEYNPQNPEIKSKGDVRIMGAVYDKSGITPIDSALVTVHTEFGNKPESSVFTDKSGRFDVSVKRNIQFEITAQKKEYFFDSKRMYIGNDFPQDTADLNFYLPEIGIIRLNFPTDEFNNPYKYTLDSLGIETGRLWTEELKLVAGNINMALGRIDKIILVGHTDDVGTDEYNIGLGQRRVDFVVSELIKLGIPREILSARSAGEREPLPKNTNEDVSQYRKRLRRVTMEKIFK